LEVRVRVRVLTGNIEMQEKEGPNPTKISNDTRQNKKQQIRGTRHGKDKDNSGLGLA
jgi:hypothetical protein